jgi:hypothetical protein
MHRFIYLILNMIFDKQECNCKSIIEHFLFTETFHFPFDEMPPMVLVSKIQDTDKQFSSFLHYLLYR